MSSSALLPTVRNRIDIDSVTRIQLVNAIMEGITIDFFTVMLLCDRVSLAGPIPYTLNFTKRATLQTLKMSWPFMVFGSAEIGYQLYTHPTLLKTDLSSMLGIAQEVTDEGLRIVSQAFGEFIAEEGIDAFNSIFKNKKTVNFFSRRTKMILKIIEIATRRVAPVLTATGVMLATNVATNLVSNAVLHLTDNQRTTANKGSEKCADLWKTFLMQKGIDTNVDRNVVTSWFRTKDLTNEPIELYFAENRYLKEFWEMLTYSPESNNRTKSQPQLVIFNEILPHLESQQLIAAAVLAFYHTEGLGRGFLSYLELVARYHIPLMHKDDMRTYIVIRRHAELVIRTLVNSVTVKVAPDDIRNIIPNPVAVAAIEDITYALFSGLFNFMLETRNDETVRFCFNQLVKTEFIVSSQWYDAQLENIHNGLPISQHDTLKCIALKIYANLLMTIPKNYRVSAFEEWRGNFVETNNLVLAHLDSVPDNENIDQIAMNFINTIRTHFV